MSAHRLRVAPTIANLALMLPTLALVTQVRPVIGSETPTLRVHALEVVDDQGRVRASLSVIPSDPNAAFECRVYPETVPLRLIDPGSGPDVKLSANERGGILALDGGADQTDAQFGADATLGWVRLVGKEGREQLIRP